MVLAAFLATGLALWVVVLRPDAPSRLPLAPKTETASAPDAGGDASLPADHPPVRIPEEVRTFIRELEEKAKSAPGDVETWTNLAQVQYRAGQIDREYLSRSEASFRHVLGIDPKNPDALRGLGNVHFDRDEHAAAIESYADYLEIRPDDENVRTDLGTMYLYSGKPEAAIGEYEKVIAKDPDFYQAWFNLGIARMRSGEPKPALEALEKARSLAPDETTRSQIQAMIDRSGLGSGAEDGTFQARVERSLRQHPIAGPKLVKLEWPSATEARVILDQFPMEAMPPAIRERFLERLKTELVEAKRGTGTEGAARLELVDQATGNVMATVVAEPGDE